MTGGPAPAWSDAEVLQPLDREMNCLQSEGHVPSSTGCHSFPAYGSKLTVSIAIRLPLGVGLAAVGAIALREGWATVAGYGILWAGLAILLIEGWRWLERDRDRLLRSSTEHRERAFSRGIPPRSKSTAYCRMVGRTGR